MDLYSEIERAGTASPSFSAIFLGDPDDFEAPVLQTLSLPKLMYDISMFYAMLIQARLAKRAIEESKQIYDLCGDGTGRFLRYLWHYGSSDVSKLHLDGTGLTLFSFLNDCVREGIDPSAFGPNAPAVLRGVADHYSRFTQMGSVWNIKEYKVRFLELLEAFPLLAIVEIDKDQSRVRFDDGDWINASPFIFFNEDRTFFMITVNKGEQNHQLRIRVHEFNNLDEDPNEKYVTVVVRNNEYLTMLCEAYGLETVWYSQEEYLGNCTFVVRLSEILAEALQEDIKNQVGMQPDIIPYVRRYFQRSPILDTIDSLAKPINGNGTSGDNNYALQNLLMGLIITNGALVTTHDLIYVGDYMTDNTCVPTIDEDYDEQFNMSADRLFNLVVDIITRKGYAKLDVEHRVNQCRREIDLHLRQLEGIVPENTLAYRIRADHILAEQMSSCILQLIGVEKDNLFANQEVMLSINDYFDMVNNRNADLAQSIHNIVSFLIRFYSKIAGHYTEMPLGISPHEMLEIFRGYCEKVQGSPKISEAIGRDICDLKILDSYIDNFKRIKSWNGDGVGFISKDYFMISYSHEDSEFVKKEVMHLRSRGYNIHIDEDRFRAGDNWRSRFVKELQDPDCVGMLAFLSKRSVAKDTIRFEMEAAARIADEHNLDEDEAYRFVVPVNMEMESIGAWMNDLLYSKDSGLSRAEWDNVSACRDKIDSSKIFINRHDPTCSDQLEEAVSSRVEKGRVNVDFNTMNEAELAVNSFFAFLKTGEFYWFRRKDGQNELTRLMRSNDADMVHCIYPMLVSVKETRIKRDSITILGYEVITGKTQGGIDKSASRVMLSSSSIKADDYYCIPNVRSSGECGQWMANPLLVSFEDMRDSYEADGQNR